MNAKQWVEARIFELKNSSIWKDNISVISPKRPGAAFVINIDTNCIVSQFIVWPNLSMEATAGAVEDGQLFYSDAASSISFEELNARWRRFVEEISKVETSHGANSGSG